MSNKYAPRTIQQQPHPVKLNSFCQICGEQYVDNDRYLLICTICGNRTHLNCEQLTNDEYQVLCNPGKHPNIYWKCVNCSLPHNSRQLSSLESLVELMYSQLKDLHSKVDFLCKNQQTISSILHQYHNQGKLLLNPTNCISPSQHNQFNFNTPPQPQPRFSNNSTDLPIYANSSGSQQTQPPLTNYANAGANRWSNSTTTPRYLPTSPAASTMNNLPINHLESSTSPYYASNMENDELINEDINKFRNMDIEHCISSQAATTPDSHTQFTKDAITLMKNNSVKDNRNAFQATTHYQTKNQSLDLINSANSNKLLVADRAQSKSQSCETATSCNVPGTATLQSSLYSPTQMLNHLTAQQAPQLETLSELIYDITISPPDVPNKEYLLCVLSHIESPSEFYVHVMTDESTSNNPVDDISEQLSNCYNSKTTAQCPVILPDDLHDLKGKFFAALYSSDDNYYRVRVLDVFDDGKLLVQYVDYGNTETVTVDKLNYLKPELAEVPILAVKCSLSHIKPVDKVWTLEHNYFFKNISGYDQEKIVTAYITNRPETIDYESIIEVFLWNNDVQLDGLRLDGSKDILINSLMVEIGLANSLLEDNYEWIEDAEKISRECTSDLTPTEPNVKIVATSENVTTGRTSNTSPTTMSSNLSRDLETNQNLNLTSNMLNPNTAAYAGNQSFESECSFDTETLDESRTYTDQILSDNMTLNDQQQAANEQAAASTSHVTNNGSLDKKWSLQSSDSKHKEKIEEFLTKPLSTCLETQRKPYPLDDLVPGTTVFIKITFTRSPNFFYAVLPFGNSSYEKINVDTAKQLMDKLKSAPEFLKYKELSNKMKLYYSKANSKDQFKVPPKTGWLVAAKEDQNFFRARVVQANVDNTLFQVFQVQCIDTGKVSSISKNNLYKLKPEFYELPEFAVLYSMPNIEPFNCNLVNQRKCAWSEQAKKAFMDFTFGNVFLANILEIVKCGSSSISGSSSKSSEKVLVDLLNIFEEQENVDDFMINKKYAQYVREEDRLRVELSASLESDKSLLIKDDNNNNEEDKNKENLDVNSVETNGLLVSSSSKTTANQLENDDNAINESKEENSTNDKLSKEDGQLMNATIKSLNEDDNAESMNGKLETDSKQTSIETDYSNE